MYVTFRAKFLYTSYTRPTSKNRKLSLFQLIYVRAVYLLFRSMACFISLFTRKLKFLFILWLCLNALLFLLMFWNSSTPFESCFKLCFGIHYSGFCLFVVFAGKLVSMEPSSVNYKLRMRMCDFDISVLMYISGVTVFNVLLK